VTRLARLLLVVAVGATVLVVGVPTPASAASNPIHPDNRPLSIAGATNGAVSADQLLQVSPSCVAYYAAAPSLVSLLSAAHADGVRLLPSECYRDYAGQVKARADWCAKGACDMAAVPGTSNHGWGKAVDFSDLGGELTFDSPAYLWLKSHAGWFGWNHPGVMEPGGSVPEPWHWEWVGDGGRMYPGSSFGFGGGFGIALGGAPVGSLDTATQASLQGWFGTANVAGWAIDPDTTSSTDVHVYVDGVGIALKANKARSDVAQLFAGYDASPHGYSGSVSVMYGKRQICAYGINAVGKGGNTLLGCTVATIGQDPTGSFDSVGVGTGINVQGWALDADSTGDIDVHAYVNGVFAGAATANQARPDVDAIFPGNGSTHGFSFTVPAQQGTQNVCLYAINAGAGTNTQIGCRTVTSNRAPLGFVDSVRAVTGGVTVAGWAIDPDTVGAIEVHTYIDGIGAGGTVANGNRPDLLGPFPLYGASHGYTATYAAPPGVHNVCTYGINVGAGANVQLGCRTVAV
jgi:hypothetical protein